MDIRKDKNCNIAKALTVIGDRWVLLIIRDLFVDGCCRFSDFQRSIADLNPTTLSNRLKLLESAGLIERVIYSEHPPRADYRLTQAGRDLEPVLRAMIEWGRKHAGIDPEAFRRTARDGMTKRRRLG